mgnify:CR=1 FL=1|tara:strand:- start:55 stop:630 length:576 start_codon:yes stop_codon:yes gene_type:complete
MKKLLGIVVLGLMLSSCAPSGMSYDQLQKPINSTGGHVRIYGNPSIAKITPRANAQCQRFDSQSKAINLTQAHAGGLLTGSEYSYWHYSCETSVARENKKQVQMATMINKAKETCKSLGFNEGSEKFSDCSLKLYSQSVELAAEQNKQIVMQPQSSGSNVMTIYDPARESRVLINKGQRMLSGACTLGIDC